MNLFESVFAAAVRAHFDGQAVRLNAETIAEIRQSDQYIEHAQERTTDTENVKGRFRAAHEALVP